MTPAYAGHWTLTRSIADAETNEAIACAGSAVLRLDGDTILYDEAVSLRLGGKTLRATRAYRFTSSAGAIVATFADGTPFFRLRLDASGTGSALHYCGEDVYALRLTLGDLAHWRTRWDVSGRKRLCITTVYERSHLDERVVRLGAPVTVELPRVAHLGDE